MAKDAVARSIVARAKTLILQDLRLMFLKPFLLMIERPGKGEDRAMKIQSEKSL
jgi:hypothetical protein